MKEAIVETAKELFREHGIKKVTIDDIAQKLSISKKTIYEYFRNKGEIADAVLEKILFENFEIVETIKNEETDPLEKLKKILIELSSTFENTNPLFIAETQKLLTKSYDKFLDYLNTYYFRSIKEIFQEGQQTGVFRTEIDPEVMARYGFELLRSAIRKHALHRKKLFSSGIYDFYILGIVTTKGRQLFEQNQ